MATKKNTSAQAAKCKRVCLLSPKLGPVRAFMVSHCRRFNAAALIDTPKYVIESDATIVAPLMFAYLPEW